MALSGWTNSTDFLRLSSALVTAVPLTLAAWVFHTSTASSDFILSLLNSASADSQNLFALKCNTGANTVSAITGDATTNTSATTALSLNTWAHVCGVFASITSRTIYVNGAGAVNDATSKTPSGINRTSIGWQDNAAVNKAFIGSLAFAAIWNIALSATEVAALGKGLSPLLVRRDALVGFWPLWGTGAAEPSLIKNVPMSLTGSLIKAVNPPLIMPRRKVLLAA